VVIGQAGLGRPKPQQVEEDAVKPHGVRSLDGDVILVSVAPGAERDAARLQASPAWRALKAVRSGRVHKVSDDPWRTGGGALGAERAQRDLERLLAP
jgi:iron complex transport system substrate-binding protein